MLKRKSLHSQQGLSLLESLIAILVMALGVLGILGMQMRTLADTQASVNRTQAVRLVEDLSERIKMNPDALRSLGSYASAWKTSTASTCTNCSPSALAARDIYEWKKSVASTLPLGDAAVFLAADETDDSNRRQLGVMIAWRANERAAKKSDGSADTSYSAPLAPANTGDAKVSCPDGLICHLQYIQPVARCVPFLQGDATQRLVYCP
ncbi:MAG: type IV pilus modification protein PilV [Burkholderiaceae bacterium]|jgi:type IV pilus assembly protein PilV|nr:type IV pilus modification protein PilV [Burkholderiaceae bacterium]